MSWDDEAATWDQHPAVRAYASGALSSLLEVCAARGCPVEDARVLDFGCGTGLLSELVAPLAREVVALDLSPAMIAVVEEKVRAGLANVRPLAGELAALLEAGHPLLAAPFDLVTCSSVCAFLPDYPATARQLAGLLSPGGLFLQWDWALNPEDEEPYGLTPLQIQVALQSAGLAEVVVDTGFRLDFEGHEMAPLRGVGRRA